jgi:hypothetical protein
LPTVVVGSGSNCTFAIVGSHLEVNDFDYATDTIELTGTEADYLLEWIEPPPSDTAQLGINNLYRLTVTGQELIAVFLVYISLEYIPEVFRYSDSILVDGDH